MVESCSSCQVYGVLVALGASTLQALGLQLWKLHFLRRQRSAEAEAELRKVQCRRLPPALQSGVNSILRRYVMQMSDWEAAFLYSDPRLTRRCSCAPGADPICADIDVRHAAEYSSKEPQRPASGSAAQDDRAASHHTPERRGEGESERKENTAGDAGDAKGEEKEREEQGEKTTTCLSSLQHWCVINRTWIAGSVVFAIGNGGDFIALGLTKQSIGTRATL